MRKRRCRCIRPDLIYALTAVYALCDRRAGAEIDLVLEMPGQNLWAIEIKLGLAAKPEKGFHHAREDLKPARSFILYSGEDRYAKAKGVV